MKLLICTQVVDKNHPILGFFHRWIEEFAKHFEEVHVICLCKGEFDLPKNVHVYSLGKEEGENKMKYVWRFYKYFGRIFFTVRVDYVFFHMGAIYNILAAPFFFLRKFYKTKFYWWKTHGHINLEGRVALFFVDTVFTAIKESFPVSTKKLQVVGHAIDTDLFTGAHEERSDKVLLFVGRLSRSKRIEQVLAVTRKLHDAGVKLQTRIIGPVVDEEYRKELDQMLTEENLTDFVSILPGRKHFELRAEYSKATVFINPSDNDGLDKVVLEAMVSGLIPVTANASFESILTPYDLYIKKGDIEGYANCIKKIFEMDAKRYGDLSKELEQLVTKNHALNTLSTRIFNN